ncbi:MAG TPA: SRPBCC family protein [Streptomyces sp.]|nr:SRPBCC family protein [Streptomyces sp.]
MALFRIERRTHLSADEAWRRLTAWERHGAHVPLTRVRVTTPSPTGPGTVFVARTGAGPLGFDDPMEVVRWEPPRADGPGRCRLEKRGSVVLGWAEFDVRSVPGGACVVWTEELRVRGLPGVFDGAIVRAGRLLFGRELRSLLGRA